MTTSAPASSSRHQGGADGHGCAEPNGVSTLNLCCPARWKRWKASLLATRRLPVKESSRPAASSQPSTWEKLIQVDAPRTFPSLPAFTSSYQVSLTQVLRAYANAHPEVGYCQGMNCVVGLLLLVSGRNEEETLEVFQMLMEDVGLQGFYKAEFPLAQQYRGAFEALARERLPELVQHFEDEHVESSDFLHPWFLTLFSQSLPLPAVLLIWDRIMFDGLHVVVVTAVSLLSHVQDVLLTKNLEEIMEFFASMKLWKSEADAVKIGRLLTQRQRRGDDVIPPYIKEMMDLPGAPSSQYQSARSSRSSAAAA